MKQIHVDNIIVESDYSKIISKLQNADVKQESKFIKKQGNYLITLDNNTLYKQATITSIGIAI